MSTFLTVVLKDWNQLVSLFMLRSLHVALKRFPPCLKVSFWYNEIHI